MVDLILQQFKCRKAKYRIVCLIIMHNQFSFEAWIYFILCLVRHKIAACCFDTQLPYVWNINAVGWFGVSSSVTHLAFNHVVAWEKSRENNFPSWVAVKVFPKSSGIYCWASCLSSVASLIDSCIFGLPLSGWGALSYPATLPVKTRMPAMKI